MEKVELSALTKEELIELAEALQLRFEALGKEKQELSELTEIGEKYKEHFQSEAIRLIKLVEGDNLPLIKLAEKADTDTLKELVETY